MNRAQQAEEAAALAPLDAATRQQLAMLCRSAWDHLGRPGESFDAWRRRQCMLCVERPGIRQCRREDYNHIAAHMHAILGNHQHAEDAGMRAATERRRQALAKLDAECRACTAIEQPRAYIAAIARSKFKTANIRTDLAANQIWQLIFSLRNAESRKGRKSGTGILPVNKGGPR